MTKPTPMDWLKIRRKISRELKIHRLKNGLWKLPYSYVCKDAWDYHIFQSRQEARDFKNSIIKWVMDDVEKSREILNRWGRLTY